MQNMPLLRQTVVVAVPGLSMEAYQSMISHMPLTTKALGKPVSCRIDDGKAPFGASLDRLLTVQKKQSQKRPKLPSTPPHPPEYYAISLEAMHQLDYPMPVRTDCIKNFQMWLCIIVLEMSCIVTLTT